MSATEKVLKDLGIDKKGESTSSNSYVVDIDTYDEYGRIFTILEKDADEDKIDPLEEKSVISIHTTDVTYMYEDDTAQYEISLLGDLDQEIYKLVCTKFDK